MSNEGIAAVSKEGKWGAIDNVCGVFKDRRCGYVDKLGNKVIPLTDKYDLIHPFRCGTAVVMEGKWMLPTPEKNANESDSDYLNRYREEVKKAIQNSRFGAINKKGELTVELKYQYLSYLSEALAAASIDGKKCISTRQVKLFLNCRSTI